MPWAGWSACLIVCLAIVVLHLLIGGTRYVFAIPGYTLLALAALVSLMHRPQGGRPDLWCLGSVLGFAAYLLARTATTPYEYITWFHWMLVPACGLVYWLSVHKLSSMRFRLVVTGVLLTLAMAHVTIGFVQFTKMPNFLPFDFLRPDYGQRASGFLVCPNHYAGYLELCFFLGLALTFWGRIRATWRVLVAYITLVCAAGILISGSRGSYLSVMGGLAVFAVISLWAVRRTAPHLMVRWVVVTLVCAGIGAAAVGVAISKSTLLTSRANDLIDTENMRLTMWASAWEQHQLQPLTGTGAGSFLLYGRKFRTPKIQHDPIHTHNDYLQLLAEFGWIGVGLFLVCWGAHVRGGLRQMNATVSQRQMASGRVLSTRFALILGAFCGFAALTAHAVVDFNMHIPGVALLMIWLLGWLGGTPEDPQGLSRPASAPVAWTGNIVMVVAAGGLVYLGATLWKQESVTENVRVLVRDEYYEEALEASEVLEPATVNNPYFFKYRGDAFKGLSRQFQMGALSRVFLRKASDEYAKAYERFPEDVSLAIPHGATLDFLQRYREATPVWKMALGWDPHLTRLQFHWGFHLEHKGDLEGAAEVYRQGRGRFMREGLRRVNEALEAQQLEGTTQ